MTMDKRIIPLIMCGGAGTRLWPASREVRPKQFLPLFGPRSTFQDTLMRVSDAALFDRPIVITNASYRFMVLEQLAEIGIEADVILEPMRRDSGPAIAAGAAFAQNRTSEAIVLALAADHVVQDNAAFVAACREGLVAASTGRIVTFGVKPERPATEYGYISPGEVISGEVHAVARFVEKPDAVTAADYVNSGYLWNSGNFMFPAALLLEEYRKLDAASVEAVSNAVASAGRDLGFVTLEPQAFGATKAISIDYAVMEKTSRAAVVPVSCGWSDVGSWRAVWELSDKDTQGNAAHGTAVFEDSRNCNVTTDHALVALEGVDDLVVVATADAVLVSAAEGCQWPQASRDQAEGGRTEGHRGASQGASALGQLPVGRQWRAPSGQAHRGQAGRAAVAAEASSPCRALDRGSWCGPRHCQRDREDGARERVDLHPDGRGPPDGESRQDHAGTDRGPDRLLSRGRRHHPD
ncbi:mannose-1-phosphate guanylyltransferase/mannose-6-phosphate isomerase [Bradyrhizobium sp. GM24.11]